MTAAEVIQVAVAEEGYLEKKSNSQLDSKTANAGSNNYTKYERDLVKWIGSPFAQGVAWCMMFVVWCFVKAFGKEAAKKLLGGWTAYTPTGANFFKNMYRWHEKNPQPGDIIFFKNAIRICHVGIVTRVDSQYVYTIEGNTSGANTVVANGGGVHQKRYVKTLSKIAGYGRPAYDVVPAPAPAPGPAGEHVPLNYQVGVTYTVRAAELNVRTKKASDDPAKLPTGQIIATLKAGDLVKNQATTLVNGKIWMYFGLDSQRREMWSCADSGTIAYIS